MPNINRPNLPYVGVARRNYNYFKLLTSNKSGVPSESLDGYFNFFIDQVNDIYTAIAGINAGNLPGINDPNNAGKLLTTNGAGIQSWTLVQSSNILPHSITNASIYPQTITAVELAIGGIGPDQLAPDCVTQIKILDGNVTANKIGPGAVTEAKIADDAVTELKIEDNAVTTDKILDANVTTDKILNANVTTAKIANGNVTIEKLAQAVADAFVPIGSVIEFAGTVGLSDNWKECNGQAVSRATYATLFANIGTVYGVGDGATTFNLPDRRGRTGVGIGSDSSTAGRITAATAANITLGGTFGAETHQLTIAELASHDHAHGYTAVSSNDNVANFLAYDGATNTNRTRMTGGDAPHNNTQPSIFTRYYIRAL
jgi:microcystin-dependent protein